MTSMSLLARHTADYGFYLSDAQRAQFARYLEMLLAWNERMNLTAVRDPDQIQIRHFLDSLTCATVTGDLNGRRLIDIGAGAGFPGLPLKLLYPQLQLTLVESTGKKTQFLRAVIDDLALEQVTVLNARAETVGQEPTHRESYDWAVGRGVAHLRTLLEYLLPLCRLDGHALAQKGSGVDEEIAQSANALSTLGGASPQIHTLHLPEVEKTHYLVVVTKVAPSPDKYPRRPGMPAKRPL